MPTASIESTFDRLISDGVPGSPPLPLDKGKDGGEGFEPNSCRLPGWTLTSPSRFQRERRPTGARSPLTMGVQSTVANTA